MYTCKSMWTLVLGEAVQCKTEGGDVQGHYAVANHQRNAVVGVVSRKISAACSLFCRTYLRLFLSSFAER